VCCDRNLRSDPNLKPDPEVATFMDLFERANLDSQQIGPDPQQCHFNTSFFRVVKKLKLFLFHM
jgi:hypothetical protein